MNFSNYDQNYYQSTFELLIIIFSYSNRQVSMSCHLGIIFFQLRASNWPGGGRCWPTRSIVKQFFFKSQWNIELFFTEKPIESSESILLKCSKQHWSNLWEFGSFSYFEINRKIEIWFVPLFDWAYNFVNLGTFSILLGNHPYSCLFSGWKNTQKCE